MKKTILSLAAIFSGLCLSAQIPNASLENWSNGNPVSWTTANIQPNYINVTQSNQAHAGSSAVKLGVYSSGPSTYGGVVVTSYHTSITTQTDSLTGWYKCNLLNGDEFVVVLSLYENGSSNAFSFTYFANSQSTYTRFAVVATPFVAAGVDSVGISLILDNTSGNPDMNSYVIVDDLHLGSSASGIQEQHNAMNFSAFPNPSSSIIRFTNPEDATLEIYSAEGKLLMSRLQEKGDAELDLSGLPEGLLLLVLRNDNQVSDCKIYHTL
ncbi:MAG: T9SS type A sorting domain-containing protein [Bacteroidia bacterium]